MRVALFNELERPVSDDWAFFQPVFSLFFSTTYGLPPIHAAAHAVVMTFCTTDGDKSATILMQNVL